MLLRPLAEPMVLLLVVVVGTYLALREYADAASTFVAVLPLGAVGIALESCAERALEQLLRLTPVSATSYRDC